MKVAIILLSFYAASACAQTGPKQPPPPKAAEFQLPKGWVFVQPDGQKGTNVTPYMIPFSALPQLQAGLSAGGGTFTGADPTLVRTQTEVIKALAKRIDELEERIKTLEGKQVAKK